MTLPHSDRNVVVIGGGFAGISAAIELAEAGLGVTVLEERPWLGGATFSFARRGLTIDNGQHMFLRSCTAYRDLLAKLGVTSSAPLQDALELTVLGPDGQARLRRSALPAPLHLAGALARYRLLSVPERMKAAVAMLTLQFSNFRDGAGTFEDWLARRFQDVPARRLFWDLLAVSALNTGSAQADLGLAAGSIRSALLSRRDGVDIGLAAVPLSRLHGAAAAELLARHHALVRLGVKVVSVQADPAGGYDIRLGPGAAADDQLPERGPAQLKADAVVIAVPAWEAADLAPAELAADAACWAKLEPSPVVSLHVIYGSRVTWLPFAAIVGPQLLWVVDKTASAGLHTGQYLAVSVPAAADYVDASTAGLREQFLDLLAGYFPAAATATVEDFFVTRERRATIRQTPGSWALRPHQPDGLAGLALAGAWTDTGCPDTMEGAVRSGHTAAGKIIKDLLRPSTVVTGEGQVSSRSRPLSFPVAPVVSPAPAPAADPAGPGDPVEAARRPTDSPAAPADAVAERAAAVAAPREPDESQEQAAGTRSPESGRPETVAAAPATRDPGPPDPGTPVPATPVPATPDPATSGSGKPDPADPGSAPARSAAPEPRQLSLADAESGDVESGPAKSGDVESGPAKSGEAKSGEAESGQAESGQAESDQAKSGAAESATAGVVGKPDTGTAPPGGAQPGPPEAGAREAGNRGGPDRVGASATSASRR